MTNCHTFAPQKRSPGLHCNMCDTVLHSVTAMTKCNMSEAHLKLHYVPDKRTDPWLLVYSPVPVSLIFLVYLCLVWAGPRWMKHREPVDLKVVLIVYNFVMVGLSAYMFYEVCVHTAFCVCYQGNKITEAVFKVFKSTPVLCLLPQE